MAWTLFLINSQTLGRPQAMPPALHVKQRLTRLPTLKFYSSTMLSLVKSHCLDMATLAPTDTGYLFARQHTERSLKINAYMHKPDIQKHKLRTPNTQTQRRAHIHTNTKHTSRLSLCFQLPDRPRGNQNFDTPGWKRRAGEPGGARGARVHTDTQAHTQTHSSGEHRLSLGFQAGDRPRCTENVKTCH